MPDLPSTARGAATSRRILDAAAEEFAAYGIAGSRIDRITAAARTNKAQVYGYFGSKEGLFDAVLADLRSRGSVTFDPGDLPGWAVALYDEYLRHPDIARIMGWLRLEQRPSGLLFDEADLGPKLEATAQAQARGLLRQGDPLDLLALVVALAWAWSPTSGAWAAGAGEPAADHDRRRAILRETVARAIAP